MDTFHVVEMKVSLQASPGIGNRRVLVKINLLIFHCSSKTLDKNVVIGPTAAVHADSDVFIFQYPDELRTGKLNALIGVEDIRTAQIKGTLQRIDAEGCIQSDGNLQGQNIAAILVHDGCQVNKSLPHSNVRYIGAPNPIRMINDHVPDQILIFLVFRVGIA